MESSVACPKCREAVQGAPNFCPACGEDLRGLTPTSDTLAGTWAGRVIDGRYKILEKLGEGGMGSVFKVEHVRMGKVLALKLLRPDVALDKKVRSRFQQEARVVSRLSHPNTIQVFDCGELEDGSLFIAMEFLPGRDLAWTLRTHGSIPEEKVVVIGIQVLASLAEAHEQKIIHRDIKPANVMVLKRRDGNEVVKVLDFGIAKLNEEEGRRHITGIADFVGTPAYISPEQASGEPLDARSDLYSVGAMLFELATGRGPFVGATPMHVVTQHLKQPPPSMKEVAPAKEVSPALEAIVQKALAKRREDRYASADEMREALERVRRELGHRLTDFTPVPESAAEVANRSDFDRYERSLRMRRVAAPLVALGVLAALLYGAFEFARAPNEEKARVLEVEPNDDPKDATPIALGTPVKGTLGLGREVGESDRDVFKVTLLAPARLDFRLSGLKDLNLVLSVYAEAPAGEGATRLVPILILDDAPTGEGERVDGLEVGPGVVFFAVEERRYFLEPDRPPRSSNGAQYELWVSEEEKAKLGAEVEPNDTVETAMPVELGVPVSGKTGAFVPFAPETAEVRLSTVDFYVLRGENLPAEVYCLLVPPPTGALGVVVVSTLERWMKDVATARYAAVRAPAMPSLVRVAERPAAFRVELSSVGLAVRVQPTDPRTLPGSPYGLAFVTGAPGGLGGAVLLVRELLQAGRTAEAAHAVKLVQGALPQAPGLAELVSVLKEK